MAKLTALAKIKIARSEDVDIFHVCDEIWRELEPRGRGTPGAKTLGIDNRNKIDTPLAASRSHLSAKMSAIPTKAACLLSPYFRDRTQSGHRALSRQIFGSSVTSPIVEVFANPFQARCGEAIREPTMLKATGKPMASPRGDDLGLVFLSGEIRVPGNRCWYQSLRRIALKSLACLTASSLP